MARQKAKSKGEFFEVPEAFGSALKDIRKSRKYSQLELGELSGCHFTFISQLERGVRQPTISTIFKLAKKLEVKPEELVKKTHQAYKKLRK